MKKGKLWIAGILLVAAGSLSSCMLPATKAEWDNSTLPALKQTAASAVEAVVSALLGLTVSVGTDAVNLLPMWLEEMGLRSSDEEAGDSEGE